MDGALKTCRRVTHVHVRRDVRCGLATGLRYEPWRHERDTGAQRSAAAEHYNVPHVVNGTGLPLGLPI